VVNNKEYWDRRLVLSFTYASGAESDHLALCHIRDTMAAATRTTTSTTSKDWVKGKDKIVSVLMWAVLHEDITGSGSMALRVLCILNLSTRWSSGRLYLRVKKSQHQLNRSMGARNI
jgi:hypothetical protein